MQELMFKKALAAQQNAYAPYSNYKVGACILAEDDELFTGCNIENASYSLTLCAEATAIGGLINSGRKKIKAILVVGSVKPLCTPCGACRQRIFELAASPNIPVYLANKTGIQKTATIAELLPLAFSKQHLGG